MSQSCYLIIRTTVLAWDLWREKHSHMAICGSRFELEFRELFCRIRGEHCDCS